MAGECTYSTHCAGDDTFCAAKHTAEGRYEMIGDSLYRKKLEKGCVQYREVLAEDKRLNSIKAFHAKVPGKPHHTLDDTYRLVAEHYWWEGMYFQVRDFVLNCKECHERRTEKTQLPFSEAGNVSRIVSSHSHDVLSKLNSQREAGLFCDITLKTGSGHSFVAHKSVLAAVSEYFQELFTEMDSAADPQPQVDLTGFSEESLLALLEFSYTSTLTLNLNTLAEVATMARHLRIWPALEACSAIQREQDGNQQHSELFNPVDMFSGSTTCMNSLKDEYHISERMVGFKRKREVEQEGQSALSWSSPLHCSAQLIEATGQSDTKTCDQTLFTPCQSQALSGLQAKNDSFPCSPKHRMKLMDFKSPSSKRKQSPRRSPSVVAMSPSTSTRSSSPSRRLLRSTPGAALALRRLLPKIDLSSKRKRKSSSYRTYRAKTDFSVAQSQPQTALATPVKVKQEAVEENVCSTVVQDEVHNPRAQEKYRLLSFLGLQRKSLVPDPEELSGWGQKKRLRKLKVSDYSLTTRRKPRMQGVRGYGCGLGDFAGVSSSLSLCDMTRMDLIKKEMKKEAQECSVTVNKRSKLNRSTNLKMQHSNVRTTRSKSLLQTEPSCCARPLRSQSRCPGKPIPQPTGRERVTQRSHSPPKRATTTKKQEPTKYVVSRPTLCPTGTHHNQGKIVASPRTSKSAPPVDQPFRISTESKRLLRCNIGCTTGKRKGAKLNEPVQEKTKEASEFAKIRLQPDQSGVARGNQVCEVRKNMTQGNKIKEKAVTLSGARSWHASSTNHQHFTNPLYRAIKEEPADPVPLSQPLPSSDASDLGKRQSKPPVKLLDQSFLFGLYRTPGGIKREEESVDICLTRSVSHSNTSRSNASPGIVRRDRIQARIMPDRTGLDGPHWAGIGNRSTAFSQRLLFQVKKEEGETCVSRQSRATRGSTKHKDTKRSCRIKKEQPKTKLYPMSSRRAVMLESFRRARLKQGKASCSQSSGGTHTCLQCRAFYRDCDDLIMHRIRHIEGKHWPCPLCSKTFFRQKNVRNHIKTHNPKLYKCHQCIAAS